MKLRNRLSERSVCADSIICDAFSVEYFRIEFPGWLRDSLPRATLGNHSVVQGNPIEYGHLTDEFQICRYGLDDIPPRLRDRLRFWIGLVSISA
jgi:hypothetical protein